jgi:hypothetical protein
MQKKKLPRDPNSLAARIVAMSTGQEPPNDLSAMTGAQVGNPPIVSEEKEKNPAAVALGRLGGLKGGKARAAALSATRRKEIGRAAAKARWKKP